MSRPSVHAGLTLAGRVCGRISRSLYGAARRFAPEAEQQRAVVSSTHYDMMASPGEAYYADEYWAVIQPHLAILPAEATALDLGCGQGRLSVRLARQWPAGRVVGCDLSPAAVERARAYAAAQGIANAEFTVEPITGCLARIPDRSIDAVVMTEVAFFYPGWEEDLPGIVRCLKPGGLLAVSFRPRYFYALAVARARIWENVDLVLDRRTGPVLGFSTVFTWQTSAGIRDLIGRQPSLELLDLCGIGVCSGIAGDPHDGVCQPSQLSRAEQAHLKRLELTLGREVPDGGRYILAVARRRCA